MIDLGNHFGRDESRHSEWLRERKWFVKARNEQDKSDQANKKMEDRMIDLATDVIAATELQIREFEARLDKYDSATITALMENQKQLDAVQARVEVMLQQAFVMDDGRRVFKSEDGTQVFDEFGEEVSSDELDFDLIGANRPTWEAYQSDMELLENLQSEREEIQDFQQALDGARDQVSDGDISQEELEALDAELLDMMPSSVRQQIPGLELSTPPALSSSFKSSAVEPVTEKQADLSAPSLTH